MTDQCTLKRDVKFVLAQPGNGEKEKNLSFLYNGLNEILVNRTMCLEGLQCQNWGFGAENAMMEKKNNWQKYDGMPWELLMEQMETFL